MAVLERKNLRLFQYLDLCDLTAKWEGIICCLAGRR